MKVEITRESEDLKLEEFKEENSQCTYDNNVDCMLSVEDWSIRKGRHWSKSQTQAMCKIVEKNKVNGRIKWSRVMIELPGMKLEQVQYRYFYLKKVKKRNDKKKEEMIKIETKRRLLNFLLKWRLRNMKG
ncbi:unnamed protein product [Blepharisma stoltei]|uniref:Uncharacterized protein n=1 Tax=Blepharisma stoltei TaxID=1481888 RepID=A0AAU9JN65_9CILI|nr:unnamed protein product [Blepharisma stoltei]